MIPTPMPIPIPSLESTTSQAQGFVTVMEEGFVKRYISIYIFISSVLWYYYQNNNDKDILKAYHPVKISMFQWEIWNEKIQTAIFTKIKQGFFCQTLEFALLERRSIE